MRTGVLVAALTASGVVGGIAGALIAAGAGGAPPPASPAADPSPRGSTSDADLAREVAALRARLDEMQASVATASEEASRLRGDLDTERKASAEARTRLETLETSKAALPPGVLLPADRLRLHGADGEAGAVRFADVSGMPERLRKVAELRLKTEEERWAAARDALSLTAGQEEELKAAIKERGEAMRDAIKVEPAQPGSDGGAVTVRMPDMEKIRESRKRYDERVGNALSKDQAKRWRDEGYEGALGGGGLTMTSAVMVEEVR